MVQLVVSVCFFGFSVVTHQISYEAFMRNKQFKCKCFDNNRIQGKVKLYNSPVAVAVLVATFNLRVAPNVCMCVCLLLLLLLLLLLFCILSWIFIKFFVSYPFCNYISDVS